MSPPSVYDIFKKLIQNFKLNCSFIGTVRKRGERGNNSTLFTSQMFHKTCNNSILFTSQMFQQTCNNSILFTSQMFHKTCNNSILFTSQMFHKTCNNSILFTSQMFHKTCLICVIVTGNFLLINGMKENTRILHRAHSFHPVNGCLL